MFAFLVPEILIDRAYMTAEAFLLSGIVSSKYLPRALSRCRIGELSRQS